MLDWSDITEFVADAAPVLGMALGGPLGASAGSMIASALGVKDPSPESIKKAIKEDPQAAAKLKAMEAEQALTLAKLIVADTQDARSREVELAKATGSRDWLLAGVAWFVILGFTAQVGYILTLPADKPLNNYAVGITTTYGAAFLAIMNYLFGSSAGSAAKNNMMNFTKSNK